LAAVILLICALRPVCLSGAASTVQASDISCKVNDNTPTHDKHWRLIHFGVLLSPTRQSQEEQIGFADASITSASPTPPTSYLICRSAYSARKRSRCTLLPKMGQGKGKCSLPPNDGRIDRWQWRRWIGSDRSTYLSASSWRLAGLMEAQRRWAKNKIKVTQLYGLSQPTSSNAALADLTRTGLVLECWRQPVFPGGGLLTVVRSMRRLVWCGYVVLISIRSALHRCDKPQCCK